MTEKERDMSYLRLDISDTESAIERLKLQLDFLNGELKSLGTKETKVSKKKK